MTGAAVLVVDRLGRRPLLLGGVSGIVSPFCKILGFPFFQFVRFLCVSDVNTTVMAYQLF